MARFLWLLGTIVVGIAIAIGSWVGIRQLHRSAPAAASVDEALLAQNNATQPTQPAPRRTPRSSNGNFNDSEAPPDAGGRKPPQSFIGGLRDALDDATDLGTDKDDYLKSLDEAEIEYQKIKAQNRAALERVNRRPPVSVPQSPNFILIDVPGLGYNDLGVYSPDAQEDQTLDALATAGLIFTHYHAASASPRANSCSLLTGLHTGRARIRWQEPVIPLALDDVTIAETLWRAGYSTCMVGQWRLGGADTSGAPRRQGFEDAWYTASLDNDAAPMVWNGDRRLANNQQPKNWSDFRATSIDRAISFVAGHRQLPVFLYLSLPLNGADKRDSLSLTGEHLGRLTKAVHEMKLARETYFLLAGSPGENVPLSAVPPGIEIEKPPAVPVPVEVTIAPPAIPLVSEPDEEGGPKIIPGAKAPEPRPEPSVKIIETDLSELEGKIPKPPVVEPTDVEAPVTPYLERLRNPVPLPVRVVPEVAGLRGTLGELYEGGLRAPLIVWTIHRPLGGVRDEVLAAWDIFPTFARLSYSQFVPTYINGASFADRLQVHGETTNLPFHHPFYWESHGDVFSRAILFGKWKLIQTGDEGPVQLYDLELDPLESRDVADQQPELVKRLLPLLDLERSRSRVWPLPGEPAGNANEAE